MIPKRGGTDFRGIGLVEVLWEVISGIINCRIFSSTHFHDDLHAFYAGRGTWTTTLEAKLLHKLIYTKETVLYYIFLDLCKAYDALERYLCLDILVGYIVRPRALCILRTYWV